MKLKAIALALFVAGASASYALAGDGHGRGSDSTSTTASTASTTSSTTTEEHGKGNGGDGRCRPHGAFVLNGTFVSAAGDGSSFQMNVTHANHHAKALGSPATIGVDSKTRIRKQGQALTLADLKAGDRLNVQARGCSVQAAGAAPAPPVAERVVVKPAKGSDDGDADDDGHGTTTTASTTTTGTTTTSNG